MIRQTFKKLPNIEVKEGKSRQIDQNRAEENQGYDIMVAKERPCFRKRVWSTLCSATESSDTLRTAKRH